MNRGRGSRGMPVSLAASLGGLPDTRRNDIAWGRATLVSMNSKFGRALVVLVLVAFIGLMILPFLPTNSPGILPN